MHKILSPGFTITFCILSIIPYTLLVFVLMQWLRFLDLLNGCRTKIKCLHYYCFLPIKSFEFSLKQFMIYASDFHFFMCSTLFFFIVYIEIGFQKGWKFSPTYHSRANECLQKIRGTDYVAFVLIQFP